MKVGCMRISRPKETADDSLQVWIAATAAWIPMANIVDNLHEGPRNLAVRTFAAANGQVNCHVNRRGSLQSEQVSQLNNSITDQCHGFWFNQSVEDSRIKLIISKQFR